MKFVRIDLSVESCKAALEELKKYEESIKPRLMEVCRRLADIGAKTARMHLARTNGNTDANISDPIPIDKGYKIAMSGTDVYFIEFGTGDDVNAHSQNVSVLVAPGSWSETHAKKYMNYGFWYYEGKKYEGTPAYMPMYYAGLAIRSSAQRIAKEVFNR